VELLELSVRRVELSASDDYASNFGRHVDVALFLVISKTSAVNGLLDIPHRPR
jgi:hypothetical protein